MKRPVQNAFKAIEAERQKPKKAKPQPKAVGFVRIHQSHPGPFTRPILYPDDFGLPPKRVQKAAFEFIRSAAAAEDKAALRRRKPTDHKEPKP